jgi:hypothetical protein
LEKARRAEEKASSAGCDLVVRIRPGSRRP